MWPGGSRTAPVPSMARPFASSPPPRLPEDVVLAACTPRTPGLAEHVGAPWPASIDESGGPSAWWWSMDKGEPGCGQRHGGDGACPCILSPLQLPRMRAWSGARVDGLAPAPSEAAHGSLRCRSEQDRWEAILNTSESTLPSSGDSSSWIDAQTTVTASSARPTPSESTLFQSSWTAGLSPQQRILATPFNRPLTPQVCRPFSLIAPPTNAPCASVPEFIAFPTFDDTSSASGDSASNDVASAVETEAPTPRALRAELSPAPSPRLSSAEQDGPRSFNPPCLWSFSDRVSSDILFLPDEVPNGDAAVGGWPKPCAEHWARAAYADEVAAECHALGAAALEGERDAASAMEPGSVDSHDSPLKGQRSLRVMPPYYQSLDRGRHLPLTEEDSVLGSHQSTPLRLSEWAFRLTEFSTGVGLTPCGERSLREVDDDRPLEGTATPHTCPPRGPHPRSGLLPSLKLLPRRGATSRGSCKHHEPYRADAQPSAARATPGSCTGERDEVEGLLSPWEEGGGAPLGVAGTRRATAATPSLRDEAAATPPVPWWPRLASPMPLSRLSDGKCLASHAACGAGRGGGDPEPAAHVIQRLP